MPPQYTVLIQQGGRCLYTCPSGPRRDQIHPSCCLTLFITNSVTTQTISRDVFSLTQHQTARQLAHPINPDSNKLSRTDVSVTCSPGAAVLWLQHHPGTEVRGRGLLQPRGHHLHPLAQGLQTPILHQDRKQ